MPFSSRINPALFFLAAAGLIVSFWLAGDIFPYISFDNRIDRKEAIETASRFLKERGYNPDEYSAVTWITDTDDHRLAWIYLGLKAADSLAEVFPAGLFSSRWQVHFYQNVNQSTPQRKFHVFLDGSGQVNGFSFLLSEKLTNTGFGDPQISQDSALAIFNNALSEARLDTSGFKLAEASGEKQQNRMVYTFKYQKPFPPLNSTLQIYGMVQGSELTQFIYELNQPESFTLARSDYQSFVFLLVMGSIVIFFFMLVLQLGVFLKKYHEGEVGVKTAGSIFWLVFVLKGLQAINEFPASGYGYGFGELSYDWINIVILIFKVLVLNPLYGLAAFSAWSIGESWLREKHSDKLASLDGLLSRQWRDRRFAVSTARGYLFGLAGLGLFIGLGWSLMTLTGGTNNQTFFHEILTAWFPAGAPFLNAVSAALLGELLFRLFGNLYLERKTGLRWLATLISSVIWAVFATIFWRIQFFVEPIWITFLIPFVFGIYFSVLFWKYDLLTTVMASFTVVAGLLLVPFLVSAGPGFIPDLIVSVVLILLPAVLMAAGFLSGKEFSYQPDTTPAHIRRITERVRMTRELEIARQVQMKLLPKRSPEIPGFDIAGICIPALEVGGDYYDFIDLPDGNIGIAVGDVSGKGLPAAIYMTLTKGIVQSHADHQLPPGVVLSKVNQLLYRSIEKGNFVSMFYAVLSVNSRKMTLSRAGHNPAVFLFENAGQISLKPNGLALGIEKGEVFDRVIQDQDLQLYPGNVILFYTDGYTEAMNEQKEEFGEDRLIAALQEVRHLPSEKIISHISQKIRQFAGSAPQHDDMTMVVVKVV